MTDARFSGGSVGLVIGHVGPEALLEDNSSNWRRWYNYCWLNKNELNCLELEDIKTYELEKNNGKKKLKKIMAFIRNVMLIQDC